MKFYLVGGAVRDSLLNNPCRDQDFCVVGASTNEMEKLGFESVGKDFPVFLHPITRQEYALARSEKALHESVSDSAQFDFKINDISITEDLRRRDFTINAMAQEVQVDLKSGDIISIDETVIDPFNGQQDLLTRTLRHTSEHFSEDPLRCVRAARMLEKLNFSLHPSTKSLILNLARNNALQGISDQRFLIEINKSFSSCDGFDFITHCQDLELDRNNIMQLFSPKSQEYLKTYQSMQEKLTDTDLFACFISCLPQELKLIATLAHNNTVELKKYHLPSHLCYICDVYQLLLTNFDSILSHSSSNILDVILKSKSRQSMMFLETAFCALCLTHPTRLAEIITCFNTLNSCTTALKELDMSDVALQSDNSKNAFAKSLQLNSIKDTLLSLSLLQSSHSPSTPGRRG